MANRLDNLDKIADFLRERYIIASGLERELARLERERNFDAAKAITEDPSYRSNSKFTYTLKELTAAKAGGLYYQQLYYALIVSEQKYIGKREQPPALIERGIHTKYNDGKNTQEYSFNPQLVAAALSARLRPEISVERAAVSVSPGQVSVVPTEVPVVMPAPVAVAPVEPQMTERERKIIDAFNRSYNNQGPIMRKAMDNVLDGLSESSLVTSDIVDVYYHITNLAIQDLVVEENIKESPAVGYLLSLRESN